MTRRGSKKQPSSLRRGSKRSHRLPIAGTLLAPDPGDVEPLVDRVVSIVDAARTQVVRTVNNTMVLAYWHIGREIVEFVQGGAPRAEYGEEVIRKLSARLRLRVGRGYSVSNLKYFRQFYQVYSNRSPELATRFVANLRGALATEPRGAVLQLAAIAEIREHLPSINFARASITDVVTVLQRVSAGLDQWTWEDQPRVRNGTARQWHVDHEYHVQNLLWACPPSRVPRSPGRVHGPGGSLTSAAGSRRPFASSNHRSKVLARLDECGADGGADRERQQRVLQ